MRECEIALINPNTNAQTTEMMVKIAQNAARRFAPGAEIKVIGHTAEAGPNMIVDMDALELSRTAVASILEKLSARHSERPDAVIISAFGDPALEMASERFPGFAFGIGTESMRAASQGGRRFAIATTTPGLRPGIDEIVARLNMAAAYCGTFVTKSDPLELAENPELQRAELAEALQAAITTGGADAVIIGGGPLAEAARQLSKDSDRPLIEPIPEAVRSTIAALF